MPRKGSALYFFLALYFYLMKNNLKTIRSLPERNSVMLDASGTFATIAEFIMSNPMAEGDIFLLLDDDAQNIQILSDKNPNKLPDSTVKVLSSRHDDWTSMLAHFILADHKSRAFNLVQQLTDTGSLVMICSDQRNNLRIMPSAVTASQMAG
jgi:hypothetical protein